MNKYTVLSIALITTISLPVLCADVQPEEFSRCYPLALSTDGKLLATAKDKTCSVWPTDEPEKPLFTLSSCPHSIRAAAFHLTAEKLATGCNKGCLRVYNTQTGQELNHIDTKDHIYALALHPSKDEGLVGRSHGLIELWNLEQKQLLHMIHTFNVPVKQLAYKPNGQWATATHTQGVAEKFAPENLRVSVQFPPIHVKQRWIDPNAHYMVTGGQAGSIDLHSFVTSKKIFSLSAAQLGSTDMQYTREQYKEKYALSQAELDALNLGTLEMQPTYLTKIAAVGAAQNCVLIGLQHGQLIQLIWKETEDDISINIKELLPAKELSEQPGKEIKKIVASADGSCFVSLARNMQRTRLPNGYSSQSENENMQVWKIEPIQPEHWDIVIPKPKDEAPYVETPATPKESKNPKRRECIIS